ncbi:MAG: penicillin acylase family protein [Cyclobacteriaceae bacterium]|nr:penicillin acylase family protein [Cyclobacteriaceae bacterium]
MKILKILLALIVLILVAGAAGGYWFLNSSKPQYQGELILEGLNQDVEVFYDEWGIPHIYAQNEQDVYFALGYVHAQDRLFQMEMLRRVGGGRLAEIFGPDLADTDQFMRTIGINEMAKSSAETYLSADTLPVQQGALAYLAGVNRFMKDGPTPPEFSILDIPKEEFTTVDLYRIVGYMGFTFNTAIRTDPLMTKIAQEWGSAYLNDLVLNTTRDNTTIPTFGQDDSIASNIASIAVRALQQLPIPIWTGSNSWVVGPEKTKSGYPILANDTHIGFQQPAVWYEAHLNYPGFNFYGNHLAGFPFALVGHNDFCAWGLTIFPNDDMDFYREKVHPENPQQVWNSDHWEPLESRQEIIKIKGAPDRELKVRSSRHGPIINDVMARVDSLEEAPVSFFWTYLKFPNKALHMAFEMEHSQSMDQFRNAVSLLEAPGLNVTYADREGNIAWWAAARLINRPAHVESKMILDGASGKDDPLGWHDFEENPRSENPEMGFVYSANNQPDSAYGKFYPGYYYPGARGRRIIDMLSARNDWDLPSLQNMILDDESPVYPKLVNKLLPLLEGELTPLEQEAHDQLAQWSGGHGLEDIGPTLYYRVIYQLQKNIFEDELGEEDFQTYITTLIARRTLEHMVENQASPWWDNISTEAQENRSHIVNKSFREAINLLSEHLGSQVENWQWQQVHLLQHEHPIGRKEPFNHLFNVGPFAVSGGDEVINKMDFNKGNLEYAVRSGPAMRILIDLANIENSISVLPTGQSGHPMSPHYQDQAPLYNSGRFRDQLSNAREIKESGLRKLLLKAN